MGLGAAEFTALKTKNNRVITNVEGIKNGSSNKAKKNPILPIIENI